MPMLRSLTKMRVCIVQTKEKLIRVTKALVQSIETDEEMKFLKDSEELQSFMKGELKKIEERKKLR